MVQTTAVDVLQTPTLNCKGPMCGAYCILLDAYALEAIFRAPWEQSPSGNPVNKLQGIFKSLELCCF